MDFWDTNFSVKTNDYCKTMFDIFSTFFDDRKFTDCTLKVDNQSLQAHRIVLSSSSSYFKNVFEDIPNMHPIICLQGISVENSKKVIYYMYHGEASIRYSDITPFVETARHLKLDSLSNSNINSRNPYAARDVLNKPNVLDYSSSSLSSSSSKLINLNKGCARKRKLVDYSGRQKKNESTKKSTICREKPPASTKTKKGKVYCVKPAPLSKRKRLVVKIGTKTSIIKSKNNNDCEIENVDEKKVESKTELAENNVCSSRIDVKENCDKKEYKVTSHPHNIMLMIPSLHLRDLNMANDDAGIPVKENKSLPQPDSEVVKSGNENGQGVNKKNLLSLKRRRTMVAKPCVSGAQNSSILF